VWIQLEISSFVLYAFILLAPPSIFCFPFHATCHGQRLPPPATNNTHNLSSILHFSYPHKNIITTAHMQNLYLCSFLTHSNSLLWWNCVMTVINLILKKHTKYTILDRGEPINGMPASNGLFLQPWMIVLYHTGRLTNNTHHAVQILT
jgi:hypothetical protein